MSAEWSWEHDLLSSSGGGWWWVATAPGQTRPTTLKLIQSDLIRPADLIYMVTECFNILQVEEKAN